MANENARGSRHALRAAAIVAAVVLFIALTVAALYPWRGSAGPLRDAALESGQPSATVSATIPVHGMICVICTASVRRAVQGVPGVTGVEVDLATKQARVTYRDGETSLEHIADAVARRGYKTGAPVIDRGR